MKFVEKKKVGWPGPAGNGYNARRGGVIKFLQMSVAKRWLYAAGRRCTRGRGGNEKSRRQKREGKKKKKKGKRGDAQVHHPAVALLVSPLSPSSVICSSSSPLRRWVHSCTADTNKQERVIQAK